MVNQKQQSTRSILPFICNYFNSITVSIRRINAYRACRPEGDGAGLRFAKEGLIFVGSIKKSEVTCSVYSFRANDNRSLRLKLNYSVPS